MMKKGESLILVGMALFIIFLILKTNVASSMFALLLLVIGILNYYGNNYKITYSLFAPLIYLIGLLFIYIQYKPDTFTLGINLFIIIILFIISLNLVRKRK